MTAEPAPTSAADSAGPADLTGDLAASYDALRGSGGWWARPRDVVVVRGVDAVSYLQGQLSQDVESLEVGASAPAFLLQPDGKVTAWLRVTRVGPEELVLDVDPGWGDAVVARLRRFLLRVKVELVEHRAADGAVMVSVRAADGDVDAIEAARPTPELLVALALPLALEQGLDGWDAVLVDGSTYTPPLPEVDPAAYDVIRIESGVPAMGAELTDRTIPAEAGLGVIDASVSFTKGCYTGQELVARVDSRGNNVPRQVRSLVLAGTDGQPVVGAEVTEDAKVVGSVTSVTWSPERSAPIALALVARSVEMPAILQVATADGTVAATATALAVPAVDAPHPNPGRAGVVRFR